MEYIKTDLKSIIEVSQIVTVCYFDLHDIFDSNGGEKHDFYELAYVDNGPVTIKLDDREYLLQKGDALLYMPNVFHEGIPENAGKTMGIISFVSHSPLLKQLDGITIRFTSEEKKLFFDVLRNGMPLFNIVKDGLKLKEGVSDYQIQIIKNRLELLLVSILSSVKDNERADIGIKNYDSLSLAEKIYAFLQDNISFKLNLNMLSQTFAVSVTQLKTEFRKRYNCGVINKFIELKISRAKSMLRETDLPVAEISEFLGFSTPQYFTRQFKMRESMTPSEYRHKIGL